MILPEISTDLTKGVFVLMYSEPSGKIQYSLTSCLISPKQGVGSSS